MHIENHPNTFLDILAYSLSRQLSVATDCSGNRWIDLSIRNAEAIIEILKILKKNTQDYTEWDKVIIERAMACVDADMICPWCFKGFYGIDVLAIKEKNNNLQNILYHDCI